MYWGVIDVLFCTVLACSSVREYYSCVPVYESVIGSAAAVYWSVIGVLQCTKVLLVVLPLYTESVIGVFQ